MSYWFVVMELILPWVDVDPGYGLEFIRQSISLALNGSIQNNNQFVSNMQRVKKNFVCVF